MDRTIDESEGSIMQTEGEQVSPSLSDKTVPQENTEQRAENAVSGSNPRISGHTTHFPASVSSTSPTQQSKPSTSRASGQDNVVISNPSQPERNLNLSLQIPSTPVALLDEDISPLIVRSPPASVPANIPSLQVDSSQCRPSTSSSNESLQLAQEARKDTLDVDYPQNKRKFKQSPVKDESEDSDSLGCNDERSEEAEKPRQKKSHLAKMFARKSPSKNKETSQKESASKGGRSPSRSPSRSQSPNKEKSPKSNIKEKSPKNSISPKDGKRSKSPKDGRLARSPVAEFVEKSINALFKKRHDSETEALCAALNSDSDPPKTQVKEKEKKAFDHWKVGVIPKDFDPVFDVNLSDTTCDSQSTRPSLASMDSNPLPDDAAQIEAPIEDAEDDPFEDPKNHGNGDSYMDAE